MPMNPRLMRPISVAYHPEALAWKTAVLANGGSVGTSLPAVSDFCDAIDAAGIRSKFLRLSLVCGGNLAAARVPLYRGATIGSTGGLAADDNIGPFIDDDYSQTAGLDGNGTTKCLDTGLTSGSCYAFGMEYNNVHLMVCRPEEVAGGWSSDMIGGTQIVDDVPYAILLQQSGGGNSYLYSGDYQGDYVVVGGSPNPAGMYLTQINSTPTGHMLRSDVSIKVSETFVSPISYNGFNTDILVFASSDGNAGIASPFGGRLSAYSIGKAFANDTERTAFYNAMSAFQTAIGRSL